MSFPDWLLGISRPHWRARKKKFCPRNQAYEKQATQGHHACDCCAVSVCCMSAASLAGRQTHHLGDERLHWGDVHDLELAEVNGAILGVQSNLVQDGQ